MGSDIFTFIFGNVAVRMYKDDFDMYRVFREKDGEGYTVGTLAERQDATWLFNREVQKLTREWELSVD